MVIKEMLKMLPECKYRIQCPYNGFDEKTLRMKEGHPNCKGNCNHPGRSSFPCFASQGYLPVCEVTLMYGRCPDGKKL